MVLLPSTATVLAYYDHPVWGKYAAITENKYGKGLATYIGCMTSDTILKNILKDAIKKAALWGADQLISFPFITKPGVNQQGKNVHYYFNYSATAGGVQYAYHAGTELLSNKMIGQNEPLKMEAWGIKIVVEK